MNPEICAMPMFPTLAVTDVAASAGWYETLRFWHVFTMKDPSGRPLLAHLRWARYADVLLRQETSAAAVERGHGVTLTFALDADAVTALAERARAQGARIIAEPRVQPWNARDVSIADPDGYHLTFSYGPVDPNLTIEDVASQVRLWHL
jgi:uncharacterized glyoxalase superfamily protein PhnB